MARWRRLAASHAAGALATRGRDVAEVWLGIGTNLGDREANLKAALRALRAAGVEVAAVSSVYRSEPVGHRDQPDFWNLVVGATTALAPAELLAVAKRIEAEQGRRESFRNAPRPIDIDLLLYGDLRRGSAQLELPHPRMLERGFVLRPLAELAPQLRHPVTGRSMAEHLATAGPLESTEPLFPGAELLDAPD